MLDPRWNLAGAVTRKGTELGALTSQAADCSDSSGPRELQELVWEQRGVLVPDRLG